MVHAFVDVKLSRPVTSAGGSLHAPSPDWDNSGPGHLGRGRLDPDPDLDPGPDPDNLACGTLSR